MGTHIQYSGPRAVKAFCVINADDFTGKTRLKSGHFLKTEATNNLCHHRLELSKTLSENGTVSRVL